MDTLGFDLGTGAVKAVRWNPEKGIVAKVSKSSPLLHPEPGKTEMDPAEYLNLIAEILKELAAPAGEKIGAIAFAAAAGNTVLCDDSGKALTPIISWLDTRLDFLPPESWKVPEVTGWVRLNMFPLMHLEYFRRTDPELLHRAQITMSNEYLTWHLTGKRALDTSSATPFYLVDQVKGEYHEPYLKYYGIRKTQLPPLVPTGVEIGKLLPEFCSGDLTPETRVIAGSFDHPAGARAVHISKPGELMISCGTSWVGFYTEPDRTKIPEGFLCDPYHRVSGGDWGVMFSVMSIGVEIDEFITKNYGTTPDRFDRFNSDAMNPGTPAAELVISVVRQFKEKLGSRKFDHAVMIGGPSEGTAWRHYLKKMLNIELEFSPYLSYTGAVGAAMTAAGKEL